MFHLNIKNMGHDGNEWGTRFWPALQSAGIVSFYIILYENIYVWVVFIGGYIS